MTDQAETQKEIEEPIRLWLSVEEAAPLIGDKVDSIYRDIREKQFPFRFVRIGKRIKICARSIGLLPTVNDGSPIEEGQKVAAQSVAA